MSLVYNNSYDVVKGFYDYFSNFTSSKTLLNFAPQFFYSLIQSESTTTSKISTSFIASFSSSAYFDSVNKRIYRFLHNPNYNFHNIFDSIVSDVLSRFKPSHSNGVFHVSFDHMFVEDKHTILMFTLRIGKQGIPIYFEAFPGKHKEGHGKAFSATVIKKAVFNVHSLIKSAFPDAPIVFLADRWFGNLFPLMNYIHSLGDLFVFRCKSNMKVFWQPPKEDHKVWLPISDLPHYVHCSKLYTDLEFTSKKYVFNLAFCKSNNHKEPWMLITNCDPKVAKGYYGYRFGSIEFLFKAQKTNGFYLEECAVKKSHAFDNLYSFICIANLFLTCLGTDISKNSNCYRHLGITTTRKNSKTNNVYRIISRFRAGLILFKIAINSVKYFRLPLTFTLYDT